jgi:hypothetical protein
MTISRGPLKWEQMEAAQANAYRKSNPLDMEAVILNKKLEPTD